MKIQNKTQDTNHNQNRTVAVSKQKIKPTKRHPPIHINSNLIMTGIRNPIIIAHSKTVPIKQLTTEPNKSRQRPVYPSNFLKQFEEITRVYQQSRFAQNEEQLSSLLCLDETLDQNTIYRKKQSVPLSTALNRKSEKALNELPCIAEKQVEQQREDILLQTTTKRINKSNCSTATNNRNKNTRSVNDNYITQFEPKNCNRSHQRKITIDVQSLLKSRSKTKSSLSNRGGRENTKN